MRIKAHRCNFFEPEWEDSIESLKVTGSTKKATWWTNRAPNRMKDGSRSFWLRALAVTHPSVSSPSPAGQLVPPTLVIADAAEEVTRWQLRDPLTGDRFWAVTLTSLWIQEEDAEWDLHNCGVKTKSSYSVTELSQLLRNDLIHKFIVFLLLFHQAPISGFTHLHTYSTRLLPCCVFISFILMWLWKTTWLRH